MRCCFISAAISYDAYCSMMDFIQGSEMWNPYEHNQDLVKWIATYYSVQKEEGKKRKDCHNKLPQNHISSRDSFTPASSFQDIEEDQFDKHVPTWDISFEELLEAYKTSAMKRHLPWDTEKNQEEHVCLPLHKIINKRGNFPRRITWLYMNHGISSLLHIIFSFFSKDIIFISTDKKTYH